MRNQVVWKSLIFIGVFFLLTILMIGFQLNEAIAQPDILKLANRYLAGLKISTIDEALNFPDDQIDIATAILILSRDVSKELYGIDYDIDEYRKRIDEMAIALKNMIGYGKDPEKNVEIINNYLFEELNFKFDILGKEYLLNKVLDKKKGDSVGLFILYLSIGERVGLPLYGTEYRDFIIVRYDDKNEPLLIDLSQGGMYFPDVYSLIKDYQPLEGKQSFYKNMKKKEIIGYFYNSVGMDFFEKNKVNRAITYFRKAIEINPNDLLAHYNLGIVYTNQGQYDLAIEYFNKAIEINAYDEETYYNRAFIYSLKGLYDCAIDDYTRAIKINDQFADAFINRGSIYNNKALYNLAIEDFNKAIEINPYDAIAFYNRGIVYSKKGEFNLAINDYSKAIELDPNLVEAHFNRGVEYNNKRDFNKAINDFTKNYRIKTNSCKRLL